MLSARFSVYCQQYWCPVSRSVFLNSLFHNAPPPEPFRHYFPSHPLPLGNRLLPNLESQYVFKYFSHHTLFPFFLWFWWHKFQVFFVILVFWVCYFFLQPFFSLFEGWIISTEVSSSLFFSFSSPSCHWIFVDSFKFWLFYFSVIQFPFGSYL